MCENEGIKIAILILFFLQNKDLWRGGGVGCMGVCNVSLPSRLLMIFDVFPTLASLANDVKSPLY